MSALRNLRILTNITQNNVKILINNVNSVRELRGLPKIKSPIENQELLSFSFNKNALEKQQQGSTKKLTIEEKFNKQLDTLDEEVARSLLSAIKTTNENGVNQQVIERDTKNEVSTELASKDYLPSFNLAAYVNKSPTLQQLIKLGVNLHSIERRKGLAEFVLRLDFEQNVQPYLLFLKDQGVPPDLYGELITKNPLLFKVDLDDLQTRVNYLEAKKFSAIQRQRIFSLNPFWLMFSTRRIDTRLGHFQKEFQLKGDDVRFLASKQPRLITYNMDHIRQSTFCIREEMGFDKDELRCLLLSKPRLWMMKSDELIERFAYVHQQMNLPHDMILQFPEVLTSRLFRLQQRHEFLKLLGRAQYDPLKDLYVSPRDLVKGSEGSFVREVAKSDLKTYDLFLRSR